MNDPDRTTKYVSVLLQLTFYGDYLDASEVTGYAEQWLDSALDDRDDLHGWTVTFGGVREVKGDPEGYDD